jgi:DNA-directed RNA polymerase subunit omega
MPIAGHPASPQAQAGIPKKSGGLPNYACHAGKFLLCPPSGDSSAPLTPASFFAKLVPSPLPDTAVLSERVRPVSPFPGSLMKSELVEKASEIVTDPLVLVNLVSQRVRQLNSGRSPLIPTRPSMGAADIALTEIIEGKIRLVETPPL